MGWGKGFPRRSGVQNENQKHKQIASKIFLFGDGNQLPQVCLLCIMPRRDLHNPQCNPLVCSSHQSPRLVNVTSPKCRCALKDAGTILRGLGGVTLSTTSLRAKGHRELVIQ